MPWDRNRLITGFEKQHPDCLPRGLLQGLAIRRQDDKHNIRFRF